MPVADPVRASRQVLNTSSRAIATPKSLSTSSTKRTCRNCVGPTLERVVVFGASRAVHGAGPGQKETSLAEQVERNVRQRGLLLQLGSVCDPLL